MNYEAIRVERADGMATLTLNRPDRLNTLSMQLRTEFAHAVEVLEADPNVRVLVLTGAGHVFCAGLDLAEWGIEGAPQQMPTTPTLCRCCNDSPDR